jgi:hypothetical protein
MDLYLLILGILGVWRITHLLNAENGPWNLLERFQTWAAKRFLGNLLDCFYCLSLWVSVPFALLLSGRWKERMLLWPALSAGAILLERLTSRPAGPLPATYFEEEEKSDVQLRKDEDESESRLEFRGAWDSRWPGLR